MVEVRGSEKRLAHNRTRVVMRTTTVREVMKKGRVSGEGEWGDSRSVQD
jgi:hypothetical protein